jgi:hypothetical protein
LAAKIIDILASVAAWLMAEISYAHHVISAVLGGKIHTQDTLDTYMHAGFSTHRVLRLLTLNKGASTGFEAAEQEVLYGSRSS